MNNITSRYSGEQGSEMAIHSTCHQLADFCCYRRDYARLRVRAASVLVSGRSTCRSGTGRYYSDSSYCNSERLLGNSTVMQNSTCDRLWRIVHKMFSFRHLLLIMLILSVLTFLNTPLASAELALSYPDRVYVQSLLYEFGNNETITVNQLEEALVAIKAEQTCLNHDAHGGAQLDKISSTTSVIGCDQLNQGGPNATDCIDQLCLNASGLLDLFSIPVERGVYGKDLQRLSPALLYHSYKCRSTRTLLEEPSLHERPSSLSTWGYGFIFVSIINVCSLGGAIVLPFMKSSYYKQILMFMLGLAVGSLAGSGLLFLIPEAFHLVGDENHSDYVWKATTVMGGIYLFFLIEKFLQLLMEFKKNGWKTFVCFAAVHHVVLLSASEVRQANLPDKSYPDTVATDPDYGICSIPVRTPTSVVEKCQMKDLDINVQVEGKGVCSSDHSPSLSREKSTVTEELHSNGYGVNGEVTRANEETDGCHGCKSGMESRQKSEVATVAWMIIFGDGLHNFIDGLSIGAAFTESILSGVSVSLAVICEEVPHELGDFAILLNSGMSLKKALMYNFLSACMCYVGLVGGIVLGQNTLAHDWIFAIAGGMFLYISLVDMLPEMNSAAKDEDRKTANLCNWRVFFLQNSGILIGYCLLLLMAVYGEEINFE
ncbi:metal cation symporter ZIP14-like [Liolophura sinensis]|uniref:metal cation symporter ZIP14-like n=1 Tax=Liolophura sinensis TaxID=3198878 RepID=UPI003157F21A